MKDFIYPVTPERPDKKALKPTKEYQLEALRVIASIFLFALVYIILVLTAAGLAGILSFLGIELIIFKPSFFTLMIGLGLIGLGLMVLFFLIKFIFAIKKVDRSAFLEVREKDYPQLYSFIKRLAKDTRAPMPKRIYLSTDVNASVFYDSSFLSMFFPVKKNLLIGMGFVNSVNMSEFKAVISHEFGHFSQHSMRLGSYVFNVNKMIYNMLYENEAYSQALDSWASASGYFTIFAKLTVNIVKIIQSVLQDVYVVVNKANLSLSRQMEHHADAVSAFVSGSNHLINALKRLEISDYCYNLLLNGYDRWLAENYKPVNIYEHHSEVMLQFAAENGYESENGLIRFNSSNSPLINKSRITIKDMWASHPDLAQREEFLNPLNLFNPEVESGSPWTLFENRDKLQKDLTEKMFASVNYSGEIKYLNHETFNEKYKKEISNYTYNKEYKGFFNNRRILEFNPDELKVNPMNKYNKLEEILTAENIALPKQLNVLKSDIELLVAINSDQYKIKSFDFDGKKCTRTDIPELISILEKEESILQQKINMIDNEIFQFFFLQTKSDDHDAIIDLYENYFKVSKETENAASGYNEIAATINPVYNENVLIAEARIIMDKAKTLERKIVDKIKEILPETWEQDYMAKNQIDKLEAYISKDRQYIYSGGLINSELEIFNEAMNLFITLMYEREYKAKKILLQKLIELIT